MYFSSSLFFYHWAACSRIKAIRYGVSGPFVRWISACCPPLVAGVTISNMNDVIFSG